MLIVRPVRLDDLQGVYKLAKMTTGGLTTLPPDKDRLSEKIRESVKNFEYQSSKPSGELYFLVLEDLQENKIVGTSAIYSKVGGFFPFWTYEIKTVIKESPTLKVHKEIEYLQVKTEYNGPTEVGTLFLDPQYRHSNSGRLLSLSRFMLVASHRQNFEDHILAELRGRIDENDQSIFWDSLGAHFFGVPFQKADLKVNEDKSFIDDLMPKHPIYIPLLPKEAQMVIGMVHDSSRPAMRLLEKEGFKQIREVDIFEGGPIVKAATKDIRCIRDCRVAKVAKRSLTLKPEAENSRFFLVANSKSIQTFKVAISIIAANKSGDEVQLPKEVSESLQLKPGDLIRYVELREELKL
ncbi:MAG: arginine N-succinyltransferase [Lentisphaeraceae bacterium]|nr:arginine N-succinyltransferase [Lentisphaeraceae bacterium]